MADEPMPAGRFDWERILRRVKIPGKHKYVAAILATYADGDGSRVRPGNATLAAVTGESERTVKRALAALRALGLLTVAHRGGGRGGKGKATEYQLSIPVDLLDRIDMLPPGEQHESGATQMASQCDTSAVDSSPEAVDNNPVDNHSRATQVAPQSDGPDTNEGPHGAPETPIEGPNDHFEGPPGWPTTSHIHQPPGPELVVTTQGESRPRPRPREPPIDSEPTNQPARTEAA